MGGLKPNWEHGEDVRVESVTVASAGLDTGSVLGVDMLGEHGC
jgi:hypothetical protein